MPVHGRRGRLGELVWMIKGVLGANAYEQYLAHHYGTGCPHPAMTERQFWRDEMGRAERNPAVRCC